MTTGKQLYAAADPVAGKVHPGSEIAAKPSEEHGNDHPCSSTAVTGSDLPKDIAQAGEQRNPARESEYSDDSEESYSFEIDCSHKANRYFAGLPPLAQAEELRPIIADLLTCFMEATAPDQFWSLLDHSLLWLGRLEEYAHARDNWEYHELLWFVRHVIYELGRLGYTRGRQSKYADPGFFWLANGLLLFEVGDLLSTQQLNVARRRKREAKGEYWFKSGYAHALIDGIFIRFRDPHKVDWKNWSVKHRTSLRDAALWWKSNWKTQMKETPPKRQVIPAFPRVGSSKWTSDDVHEKYLTQAFADLSRQNSRKHNQRCHQTVAKSVDEVHRELEKLRRRMRGSVRKPEQPRCDIDGEMWKTQMNECVPRTQMLEGLALPVSGNVTLGWKQEQFEIFKTLADSVSNIAASFAPSSGDGGEPPKNPIKDAMSNAIGDISANAFQRMVHETVATFRALLASYNTPKTQMVCAVFGTALIVYLWREGHSWMALGAAAVALGVVMKTLGYERLTNLMLQLYMRLKGLFKDDVPRTQMVDPSLVCDSVMGAFLVYLFPSHDWSTKRFADFFVQFGRVGHGIDAVVSAVIRILQYAIDFGAQLLGFKTFTLMRSCIPKVDKWVEESRDFLNDWSHGKYPKDIQTFETVLQLEDRAFDILSDLAKTRTAPQAAGLVRQVSNSLTRIRTTLESLGVGEKKARQPPLVIMLRGVSQIGKSRALRPFVVALLECILPPEKAATVEKDYDNYVYSRFPEQEYWDGYWGQLICLFDEFDVIAKARAEAQNAHTELIRAGNVFPYALHMAALEQKGNIYFRSKIIICTSNTCTVADGARDMVSFPEAVVNRFHFECEMMVNEAYARDEDRNSVSLPQGQWRLDRRKLRGNQFNWDVHSARIWIREKLQTGSDQYHYVKGAKVSLLQLVVLAAQKYEDLEATGRAIIEDDVEARQMGLRARKMLDSAACDALSNEIVKCAREVHISEQQEQAPPEMEAFVDCPTTQMDEVVATQAVPGDTDVSQDWAMNATIAGCGMKISKNTRTVVDDVMTQRQAILAIQVEAGGRQLWRVLGGVQHQELHTDPSRHLLDMAAQESLPQILPPELQSRRPRATLGDVKTWIGEKFDHLTLRWVLERLYHYPNLLKHVTLHQLARAVDAVKPWARFEEYMGSRISRCISGSLDTLRTCGKRLVDYVKNCFDALWQGLSQMSFGDIALLLGAIGAGKFILLPALKAAVAFIGELFAAAGFKKSPRIITQMTDPGLVDIANKVWKKSYYEIQFDGDHIAWGFFLRQNVFVFCWHYVEAWTFHKWGNYLGTLVSTDGQYSVDVALRDLMKAQKVGPDLACAVVPSARPHPDITKLLCDESMLSQRDDFDAVFLRRDSDGVDVRDYAKCFVKRDLTYYDPRQKPYTVPVGLRYEFETVVGDCGLPIFIRDPTTMCSKFVGIHVSGDMARGFGCPFTKQLKMLHTQMNEYSFPSTMKLLGRVPRGPGSSGKSQIRASKLHGAWGPATKAPAHLKPFRNEQGEKIDPWDVALARQAEPAPVYDPDLVSACVSDVIGEYFGGENAAPKFGCLSIDEAIFGAPGDPFNDGLNRQTSPGFPHNLESNEGYRGKQIFLGRNPVPDRSGPKFKELMDSVTTMELGYVSIPPEGSSLTADILANTTGHVDGDSEVGRSINRAHNHYNGIWDVRTVFCPALKDEVLPHHKVDAGATRPFCPCPIEYQILWNVYWKRAFIHMMRRSLRNECAVGINPYGDDWASLHKKVTVFGEDYIIAGDFKHFDSKQSAQILKEIGRQMLPLFDDSDDSEKVRWGLWRDVYNSVNLYQTYLVEWNQSLPSGHPATTLINCLYNSVIMRMAYVTLHDGDVSALRHFKKNVSLVVYGDDNLLNVAAPKRDIFNQRTLTEAMRTLGMVYTSEDKSSDPPPFRNIREVEFLKRKFYKEGGRWLAPLRLSSITEMPYWTKTTDPDGITRECVDNALRELALHPEPVWKEWTDKICEESARRLGYRPVRFSRRQLQEELFRREIRYW